MIYASVLHLSASAPEISKGTCKPQIQSQWSPANCSAAATAVLGGQPSPCAHAETLNGEDSLGNCHHGPGKNIRVARSAGKLNGPSGLKWEAGWQPEARGMGSRGQPQAGTVLPWLRRGLEGAGPMSAGCSLLCKATFAAASAELLMDQHPLSHGYCFI